MAGVYGMSDTLEFQQNIDRIISCQAYRKDLDGGGILRQRVDTEDLIDMLGIDEMWDRFGVVAETVVSLTCSASHIRA